MAPAPASGVRARDSVLVWAAICTGVAVASLVAPSVPDADPWGWMIWGRQIDAGTLVTTGYPSWKPLPAVVAALTHLVGLSPEGWLVLVRTAGVATLLLAYRLAVRWGGTLAGVVSVVGLALFPGELRFLGHGTSEPLLVALLLGAVEAHLARRRALAYGLVWIAGLLRPEAWPFLLLYGLGIVALRARGRAWIAASLALLVALWLVPDWLGSGDPLHGSQLAKVSAEAVETRASAHPAWTVLSRATGLVVAPVALGALVALVVGARRRVTGVLVLGGLAAGWLGIVVGMTLLGYAGVARFADPAAALVCILGGVAVGWLVGAVPVPRARLLAGGVALAALVPFVVVRASAIAGDAREIGHLARTQGALARAVAAVGGPRAVLDCGIPTTNPILQTALAWDLGVATNAVERPGHPAVVFVARSAPFPNLGGVAAGWPRRPVGGDGEVAVRLVGPLAPGCTWGRGGARG